MASLQAYSLLSSSSSSCLKKSVNIGNNVPRFLPYVSRRKLIQESKASIKTIVPVEENNNLNNFTTQIDNDDDFGKAHKSNVVEELFAILEAVCDRIEMHHNVGEQRDNWNSLLLNSLNMITLAATTIAGVAASSNFPDLLALKLSSTLLFCAATGMVVVMNKIQPSQLGEEQRIARRLFRQLQTKITLGNATEEDVKSAIEKVLALDRAYPLPILGGAMLEKFPSKFEPGIWWPSISSSSSSSQSHKLMKNDENNGWSEELELEMREIIEVLKRKDMEDYDRLGSMALKTNKILAILGPLLTGIAALGSIVGNNDDHNNIVPAVAGTLASVINVLQHGGQVGMVVEMYRNCAGFFKLMEETVEATLEEKNFESRENGNIFEIKMALQLGRSVSQLKELASKSAFSRSQGTDIDEFASKIF